MRARPADADAARRLFHRFSLTARRTAGTLAVALVSGRCDGVVVHLADCSQGNGFSQDIGNADPINRDTAPGTSSRLAPFTPARSGMVAMRSAPLPDPFDRPV